MIDKQKYWNDKVMDQLIEKLGYMDYRDFLACNKYIMEAKKHGDIHQETRAKILTIAMRQLSTIKREEIEKQSTKAGKTNEERE